MAKHASDGTPRELAPEEKGSTGAQAADAAFAAGDDEVARLRADLEDASDRVLRAQAELDNYRKRARRELPPRDPRRPMRFEVRPDPAASTPQQLHHPRDVAVQDVLIQQHDGRIQLRLVSSDLGVCVFHVTSSCSRRKGCGCPAEGLRGRRRGGRIR